MKSDGAQAGPRRDGPSSLWPHFPPRVRAHASGRVRGLAVSRQAGKRMSAFMCARLSVRARVDHVDLAGNKYPFLTVSRVDLVKRRVLISSVYIS